MNISRKALPLPSLRQHMARHLLHSTDEAWLSVNMVQMIRQLVHVQLYYYSASVELA